MSFLKFKQAYSLIDVLSFWNAALQAILDDQIVKTQSMRASPFIGPLEKEALEWDETLNRLQEVVDNWLACQATWQYLEPIFTSPDIMKQMPEEGDKFLQACLTFKIAQDLSRCSTCVQLSSSG